MKTNETKGGGSAKPKGNSAKGEKLRFTKKTRKVLTVLLWIGAFFPVFFMTYLIYSQSEDELPSVEMLENPPELLASIIYADDGKTELGRYWSVNRTTVDYKEISPYVIDALIATEDERFMEHPGVDFRALSRAVLNMGEAGGASTISQQLAKLLFTLEQRERMAQLRMEGKDIPEGPTGIWRRIDEKIKENIIAVRLEERYTKEEIITMYLNQFDFLYNAVGIENAAKVYFNKKPIDLSKEEAAMLVGMCKNPSMYNPHTYQIKDYRPQAAKKNAVPLNSVTDAQIKELRDRDSIRAIQRRNQVLFQWLRNSGGEHKNEALKNYVTQEEVDSLKEKRVLVDYQVVDHKEGLAPYFRESLRAEITELFEKKDEKGNLIYHKKNGDAYNIYKDGLKIYTTINVSMQEYAEAAVSRHLREDLQPQFDKNNASVKRFPFADNHDITDERIANIMSRARKNSDRYNALKAQGISANEIERNFDLPVPMRIFSWKGEIDTVLTPNDSIRYYKGLLRAGLLSIDPNTGFIKAWVGGVDFKHFAFDHVKQSKRQVGSTIKPFVYSTAIAMGAVKPCTVFEDMPYCVDLSDGDGKPNGRKWCPAGKIPVGKTVAWALAQSNNPGTVAVMSKMGGYAGPKTISKVLRGLQINLRPEDEVPSMCLGIMDMSLYEMVGAQAMFVNQGIFIQPTTILRIEDRNGNVIYNAEPYTKEVLNCSVAHKTLEMMKGVIMGGTGSSLRSGQKWGGLTYPMAGKTGTTQKNSDGWFMGLTPDLVTGVWSGAEDRDVHFRSMLWGQGARMALPIYGYYMQKVYKDTKLKISTSDFVEPIGYDPTLFECDGENEGDSDPLGID